MFIVEGRALGVLAALALVVSMVLVFDRLPAEADSTEPRSPPAAVIPPGTAPLAATRPNEIARPRESASRLELEDGFQ